MVRYRLLTPPEGADDEWVYLDTVSRTYFRIAFYSGAFIWDQALRSKSPQRLNFSEGIGRSPGAVRG